MLVEDDIIKVLVGLSYCRAHDVIILKPLITDTAAEKMISNDATTSLRCLLLGMVVKIWPRHGRTKYGLR